MNPRYKSGTDIILSAYATLEAGGAKELMAVNFRRMLRTREAVHDRHLRGVHRDVASDNFEEFLEDLSTTFVRAAAEDIDNRIELWLQRIVISLALDRGTLTQFDSNRECLWATHQWARDGVDTPDQGVDIKRHLPWLAAKIAADELVAFSNLPHGLPREASRERHFAKAEKVKAHISLPLKIGESVVGGLSFATVLYARKWSKKDILRLKLVAEIFSNALERKRAFAEHRRLEQDLRKMEGVALVGELAAILAHELKQPLTAILNNAETAYDLIKRQNPNRVEIAGALADIIRDDARADEIIRNVRALFQRSNSKKSSIDLKELLVDVERIANMSARTNDVRLSIEVAKSLPSVLGDRTQLTQATLNLLFNAFDSVCAVDAPREVSVSASQTETGRVRVRIRDSGTGIDPEIMPRVFEPFFTTKATGMGMGLAIVRSVIENHGGKIWAKRNPDRGATFEFELPGKIR